MTIIQIGTHLRVNLEDILDVSDIIPPSFDQFDDSEDSEDDEDDWTYRFEIKTKNGIYTITEHHTPDLKTTHAKLTQMWLEYTKDNVIKL